MNVSRFLHVWPDTSFYPFNNYGMIFLKAPEEYSFNYGNKIIPISFSSNEIIGKPSFPSAAARLQYSASTCVLERFKIGKASDTIYANSVCAFDSDKNLLYMLVSKGTQVTRYHTETSFKLIASKEFILNTKSSWINGFKSQILSYIDRVYGPLKVEYSENMEDYIIRVAPPRDCNYQEDISKFLASEEAFNYVEQQILG